MSRDYPEMVPVDSAPDIPGLTFRHFGGEIDYPDMVRIANECVAADGDDWNISLDELKHNYAYLTNCNLATDMLIAEIDGVMVGYWRGQWWDNADGNRIYPITHWLHPTWRGQGIGRAALLWLEDRLRHIAADHDPVQPKLLQGYVSEGNHYLAELLEAHGYKPVRHFYTMVRPTLDDIPDFPLPPGLEVRPVLPEQYRAIWNADIEAFRDAWGFGEPEEQDYQRWLENKVTFQPELWQVAWDVATDEIAGQVQTFIDHAENERFGRRRGYTENISVRRPYRRRGLARALIVRSLRAQRAAGMTASALGVDSDSPTGAPRVYEECGFRVTKTSTLYRKSL
jgi:GNAT superfamily N-acetyltransferase